MIADSSATSTTCKHHDMAISFYVYNFELYRPITTTHPSSSYWGFDACLTYGEDTAILPGVSGILDTGGYQQWGWKKKKKEFC